MEKMPLAWRSRYVVRDENRRDRWLVRRGFLLPGRRLWVRDAESGAEIAFIRRKFLTYFFPRYIIKIGDTEYLFEPLTLLSTKYIIRSLGWIADGWCNYTVMRDNDCVMRVSNSIRREFLSLYELYELDISDERDELYCLCVALAIECIVEDASSGD
jgi:uncharacterized protein YxjI